MFFTNTGKSSNTKDRISDALAELIAEKQLGDITVAELSTAAGVGKSTFYRNFHDIYDVFEYLSNGFVNRVCDIMLSLVFEFPATNIIDLPESIDYRLIMTMFGLKDSDMTLVNYLFRVQDSRIFRSVVRLFVDRVGEYAVENGYDVDAVRFCTKFVMNGVYYSALTGYLEEGKFDTSLFTMLKYFDLSELK